MLNTYRCLLVSEFVSSTCYFRRETAVRAHIFTGINELQNDQAAKFIATINSFV